MRRALLLPWMQRNLQQGGPSEISGVPNGLRSEIIMNRSRPNRQDLFSSVYFGSLGRAEEPNLLSVQLPTKVANQLHITLDRGR
jgi:hypothetical protein